MDVGRAIKFVFEDERWVSKILLGAVISLVPFFGAIVLMGYAIAVLRNVKRGSPRPLPDWDRIGKYFGDGLLYFVALLIYSLPLLILICPIALLWILPAIAEDQQELTRVLTGIAGVATAGLGCLALLYALFLWVLSPVLQVRYADAGDLAACLRFGEVFRFLFAHIGKIVIAQLLVWLAGLVVTTTLGVLIGAFGLVPVCGWLVAALLSFAYLPIGVWLTVFAGYLYGQIGPPRPAPVVI